jgi:hypothetical protein
MLVVLNPLISLILVLILYFVVVWLWFYHFFNMALKCSARVRGNEITDGLARDGSALRLLGPEPALGISRCDIRRKLRCWLSGQHWAIWRDLANTLRQARELISGPCPCIRIKLLSFNRNQSRVVTGLLTSHNTLRRHLHLMGLLDSPLCRKCGVKEETLAHILCECEALDQVLIKSQQNWLKQGVGQFAVRSINLLFLFRIRRNCQKNGRSRS